MAEVNPKVMEMIEAELGKNPEISNKELLEKARAIDKKVDQLTARQFNATYPLQVKRAMKPARKRGGGKRTRAKSAARGGGGRGRASAKGDRGREQVRKVLVELAKKSAEGDRGALVEVVAGIDGYVDRVLKAAG